MSAAGTEPVRRSALAIMARAVRRASDRPGRRWRSCCVVLFAAAAAPLHRALRSRSLRRAHPAVAAQSAQHWFGTDQLGRDTLRRVIYSSRMALLVGVGVVLFALADGRSRSASSRRCSRGSGNVLMRIVDVLMAFPSLLLALGLIVILGPSVANSIIAIGAGFLTTTTRIVYGLTLRLKTETYVEAARSMGSRTGWLVLKHILPNLISPLLVQASFVFAFAQLSAASLDFLGLGAPPDIPSWGNMLAESRNFITRAPWLLFFPGVMIVLTAFALNLVGDSLARPPRSALPRDAWQEGLSPMLSVENLTVSIGPLRRRPTSSRTCRSRSRNGEILGLVGESGCGKSMTSLAIMGLLPQARSAGHGPGRSCSTASTSPSLQPWQRVERRHPVDGDDLSGADDLAQSGTPDRRPDRRGGAGA